MTPTRIGYARCSTDRGLTGTNRDRPGLAQALAAVRAGDTLVAPKLDRLARSVPDTRGIADALVAWGVRLALGASVYDPADPMGKMFFNILATFAEFEADLIRLRTREGMVIAHAKGKLRGKRPKLSERREKQLRRMHDTGDCSISDLAELFAGARPTVYRTCTGTRCSRSKAVLARRPRAGGAADPALPRGQASGDDRRGRCRATRTGRRPEAGAAAGPIGSA